MKDKFELCVNKLAEQFQIAFRPYEDVSINETVISYTDK